MNPPHRLTVWRKADLLVQRICVVLASDHTVPHADLSIRARRAATEIPLAIDAGSRADTAACFAAHVERAIALTYEVQYLLTLHEANGRLGTSECARLVARSDQVQRMLAGLLRTIEQGNRPASGATTRRDPGSPLTPRRRSRPSRSSLDD